MPPFLLKIFYSYLIELGGRYTRFPAFAEKELLLKLYKYSPRSIYKSPVCLRSVIVLFNICGEYEKAKMISVVKFFSKKLFIITSLTNITQLI